MKVGSEIEEVEKELRLQVRFELLYASPGVTPKIYEMIQSKEGYKKAESMIIDYAIKNDLSISASVAQLEAEL